ncbi:hypothetical protein HNY73_022100 [Argiope bruennichi]|uniref:Uncharacterized protein n=1 Tax=Argiope bruennichi TaxID=94029 RepID=A0A8T0E0U8_ARGBR|nr:hypothetical protein HNY73_022100 [Argiope bruennichi]
MMKHLVFLLLFGLIVSTYAINVEEYIEHFAAVGCSRKVDSTGSNFLIKVCGSCLRYTTKVVKIDQGLCGNVHG